MNQGELIRKLREERELTQEELSHKIMPRTTLSSIENGGRTIEVSKLIKLLNRMNISLEEYSYLLNLDAINEKKRASLMLSEVEDIVTEEFLLKKYRESNDKFYYFLYIQNILVSRKYSRDKNELILPIKQHLDRVETWGHFEISLFSNCLFIFEEEYIIFNLKNITTKLRIHLANPYFSRDLEMFLLNCLILSFEQQYSKLKEIVFNLIEELSEKDECFRLKILGKFFKELSLTLKMEPPQKMKAIAKIKDHMEWFELHDWIDFIDYIVGVNEKDKSV